MENKESNNISYFKIGNYYMPNLVLTGTEKDIKLGKYGKTRAKYLKHNKDIEYTILLMDNKLQEHLLEVDETANKRFKLLMKQLAEKENITEELKSTDQLKWVGMMNNIKNQAKEIILKELIYV